VVNAKSAAAARLFLLPAAFRPEFARGAATEAAGLARFAAAVRRLAPAPPLALRARGAALRAVRRASAAADMVRQLRAGLALARPCSR
jgi:hypothetical protein